MIPIPDILYFEADQKYVRAWHRNGDDLIDESLKALEEEFGTEFVRTHRKVLAAIDYIESLEKGPDGSQIRIRGREQALPVSRRHVAQVRERLTSLATGS